MHALSAYTMEGSSDPVTILVRRPWGLKLDEIQWVISHPQLSSAATLKEA